MVWVGKELPDMRQSEREIKFIRMGDAVKNSGLAQGRTNVEWESLVHFYTQGTRSGIGVLWVICWLDEACILRGWGGEEGKYLLHSSIWVGGETGYTAPLTVTTRGREGHKVWFFHSCDPRPSAVICSFTLWPPQLRLSLLMLTNCWNEAIALCRTLNYSHHKWGIYIIILSACFNF